MFPRLDFPPTIAGYPPFPMGVPGVATIAMRFKTTIKVLYVDNGHADANDNNDGTDPDHPLLTIQEAVDKASSHDIIQLKGSFTEDVTTLDYATGPNYVTIIGAGNGRYSVQWQSATVTAPAIDMQAVGWRLENIRFYGNTQAACVELHHTDLGGNDIAIRTVIKDCYFDGLTTGRYGILSHGCYDVWVVGCTFALWHNAVAGGAVPMLVGTTPLAIPYRNYIIGNYFHDSDNGAIWPCNGSFVQNNMFQPTGYAYAMTQVLNTSIVANPGDDNVVWGNCFPGDYSIAGGYRPGAADAWLGNWADDTAEAEVGDNGITVASPT